MTSIGLDDLKTIYAPPSDRVVAKQLARIDRHAANFIGMSPFCVLATSGPDGTVDASPRGGNPGFIRIENETRLLMPDRPGNNRIDSFRNIVAHPGVGLLFFVPGVDETLRVNGRASLTTDTELLAPHAVQGKTPRAAMLVEIDEVFFHCGKALKRSSLWNPEVQIERSSFPTLGRIIADQTRVGTAEEADKRLEESYRTRLY